MPARSRAFKPEPAGAAPVPNEHTRRLVEALRHAGTAMGQRWLDLLARAAPSRRAALIADVERLITDRYGGDTVEVTVRQPPVQRAGYIEETEAVYRVRPPGSGAAPVRARAPRARRGAR